jgi:hypothetical protein
VILSVEDARRVEQLFAANPKVEIAVPHEETLVVAGVGVQVQAASDPERSGHARPGGLRRQAHR